MKVLVKSGRAKTVAFVNAFFSESKEFWATELHQNAFFYNNSVKSNERDVKFII